MEAKGKWDDSPAMQHWQDFAWQVQDDTERVLIERAIWLQGADREPRISASPAAWA